MAFVHLLTAGNKRRLNEQKRRSVLSTRSLNYAVTVHESRWRKWEPAVSPMFISLLYIPSCMSNRGEWPPFLRAATSFGPRIITYHQVEAKEQSLTQKNCREMNLCDYRSRVPSRGKRKPFPFSQQSFHS